MKLGIMQPYFVPYIGYLQLMEKCDHWVIFDNVQFRDKGWVNRNKIIHPDLKSKNKSQFITIPIKKSNKIKIKDILISDDEKWRQRIFGKFSIYKKKFKYYEDVKALLNKILEIKHNNLSSFLVEQIFILKDYFNLTVKISVQSKTLTEIKNLKRGEWALEISKKIGAKKYINPIDGIHLFDKNKFIFNKIILSQFKAELSFDPKNITQENLSILDTLAKFGYEKTKQYIKLGIVKDV